MPILLNGDTGITTPGLTNTGSTTLVNLTTTGNTILGDQSTDTLNVANGNLVLNSSGNLGIGTASPTTKLSITDSAGPVVRLVRTSNRFELSADTDFMSLNARDASTYITFKTADTERVRITAAGDVGIGTSSPARKLDVSDSSTDVVKFTTSAVSDSTLLTMQSGSGVRMRMLPSSGTGKYNWQIAAQTNIDNGFEITPSTASGGTTFSTPAVVVLSSGNVGIGTSSPGQRLDVNGNIRTRDGGVSLTTGTTQQGVFCTYNRITGSGTDYTPTVFSETGLGMYFAVNGSVTKSMMLDASGNFHIGTTTTAGKLSVGGKIRTLGGDIELDSGQVTTNSSANPLRLGVDGVEKARISSNGQLLVGLTSAPASASVGVYASFNSASYGVIGARNGTGRNTLAVLGDSNFECGYLGTSSPTGTDALVEVNGTNGVRFTVSGTERVRVTSAGNVGIGTGGANYRLTVYSPTVDTDVLTIANNQINGDALQHYVGLSLQDNNGSISGAGNASAIRSYSNLYSSWGSSLTFWTTGSSGVGVIERARIDSSGNLLVGTTSSSDLNVGVKLRQDGLSTFRRINGDSVAVVRLDSNGDAQTFYRGTSGVSITQVGSISVTSSATSYNTSSDYRLKNTIAPMTGALAKVAQLKPVTYKWNVDGSDGEGFIAHELAEVCPQAVTGEKDAVDEEGKPQYQGIDVSFLVATLTAAIQELKSELDSVKTELAALKGN